MYNFGKGDIVLGSNIFPGSKTLFGAAISGGELNVLLSQAGWIECNLLILLTSCKGYSKCAR